MRSEIIYCHGVYIDMTSLEEAVRKTENIPENKTRVIIAFDLVTGEVKSRFSSGNVLCDSNIHNIYVIAGEPVSGQELVDKIILALFRSILNSKPVRQYINNILDEREAEALAEEYIGYDDEDEEE